MKMGHSFKDDLTKEFHDHYRRQSSDSGPPWITWHGVNVLKCPMDLWIYQEILHEVQPDFVIEGGTAAGGSALYMAHVLDAIGHGKIVTMDWDSDDGRPTHPRIQYVKGNTLDSDLARSVLHYAFGKKVLILDDGHDHEHVCKELHLYATALQAGDYLIVEDTNLGGPLWGLERYLEQIPGKFERDSAREKLLLTFNPMGYWKCIV